MYESFNIIDPVTKENYPQSIYHNVKTLQWVANPKILRQGDARRQGTGAKLQAAGTRRQAAGVK